MPTNREILFIIKMRNEAGRAIGGLRKNLNSLGKAASDASKQVNDANSQLVNNSRNVKTAIKNSNKLTSSVKDVGNQFGALKTILAGAGFTAVASTLAGFEKQMARVGAIAGASSAQFKLLETTARNLGATTSFSATQAAEGLEFLVRAGFSAEDASKSLESVLNLAAAGNLSLAESADIASNVMSGFAIEAENASKVSDILAAANTRSNTDVRQLGEAMKFVAPVSRAFGQSLENSAAAAGILSDNGLQASLAGTGLRRVFSELANPSKQAVQALAALGITLEQVNPLTNDLTDIVDLLKDRGLGAADALTIFGDRGGPAILALTNNNEKLRELRDGLTSVEGEASRLASQFSDNLSGDFLQLISATQEVILSLGDAGLTGLLRDITQLTISVVRQIDGFVDALSNGSAAGKLLIAALTGLGSAFTLLFAANIANKFLGITTAMKATIVTVKALTVALLANPFTLIATAISAVIGLLVSYRNEMVTVGDNQARIIDIIRVAWDRVYNAVVPVINQVIEFGKKYFEVIRQVREFIINNLQAAFSFILQGFKALLNNAIATLLSIRDAVVGTGQLLKDVFGNALTDIGKRFSGLADIVEGAVTFDSDQISRGADAVSKNFEVGFKESFANIRSDIVKNFETDYVQSAVNFAIKAGDTIKQNVGEALNEVGTEASQLLNGVVVEAAKLKPVVSSPSAVTATNTTITSGVSIPNVPSNDVSTAITQNSIELNRQQSEASLRLQQIIGQTRTEQEQYALSLQELKDLRAYAKTAEEVQALDRATKKLNDEFSKTQAANDNVKSLENAFRSAKEQGVDLLSGAITDLITKGKVNLKSLSAAAADVALNLANAYAQSLAGGTPGTAGTSGIAGPSGGGLGGLVSTGIQAIAAGFFSKGGMSTNPKEVGLVPSSVFGSARKFNTGGKVPGLGNTGIPAVLHPGERVLNRKETKAYDSGQQIVVNMNITGVTDAESFRRSESQLGLEAGRMIQSSMRRFG